MYIFLALCTYPTTTVFVMNRYTKGRHHFSFSFQASGQECRLRIKGILQTHFGEWKCEISSWGESGAADVVVKPSLPVEVEFDGVWGTSWTKTGG